MFYISNPNMGKSLVWKLISAWKQLLSVRSEKKPLPTQGPTNTVGRSSKRTNPRNIKSVNEVNFISPLSKHFLPQKYVDGIRPNHVATSEGTAKKNISLGCKRVVPPKSKG